MIDILRNHILLVACVGMALAMFAFVMTMWESENADPRGHK
jgi:hypothetical protein